MNKVRNADHMNIKSNPHSDELLPIDNGRLRSIATLCTWVANEQASHYETIHSIVLTRFSVAQLSQLRKMDFDNVVKMLVDLRVNDVLN